MPYRSEIDGLRAIAVVVVILFHAGLPGLQGGFVGVDIFFVISGFLITSILEAELRDNRFSLAGFYERRCRRILPALYLVTACTIPFAVAWTFPLELREFWKSILAAITFYANFFFARTVDYFSPIGDEKPLLHTWSLSVEEQFYLLFPLLLWLIWRIGRAHRLVFLSILLIASFALAEWLWFASGLKLTKLFFFTPGRVFELLVGAICSIILSDFKLRPNMIYSYTGLLFLLVSVSCLDEAMPYPSHYTLLPVIGTALILLFSNSASVPGRVLSHPAFVGIGRISYSAYLWHVPLIALYKTRSIEPPSTFSTLVVALCAFPLAFASWRFVEMPFRKGVVPFFRTRAQVFISCALGAVVLSAVAGIGYAVTPGNSDLREMTKSCNYFENNCFSMPSARVFLWGDSYADAFAVSLGRFLNARGEGLEMSIRHGCPSLVGVRRIVSRNNQPAEQTGCTDQTSATIDHLEKHPYPVVILAGSYVSYSSINSETGRPIVSSVHDDLSNDPLEIVTMGLRDTVSRLRRAGSRVIVVTPHATIRDFAIARKEIFYNKKEQVFGDYERAARVRNRIVDVLADAGLDFYEVKGLDWFCKDGMCPMVRNGRFVLFDGDHLSVAVAPMAASQIGSRAVELLADPSATKH